MSFLAQVWIRNFTSYIQDCLYPAYPLSLLDVISTFTATYSTSQRPLIRVSLYSALAVSCQICKDKLAVMNSFVSLFDPDEANEPVAYPDFSCCQQLPPEPCVGNIEYKLKLVNPSKLRFQHLVTQMKWRLREGQGEAIYEIGVEDDGALAGLQNGDLAASLQTLERMAVKLGAACTVMKERVLGNGKKIAEVLVRKVPDDQNIDEVRVAVIGNTEAGKSTLVGVLTHGEYDNGRGRARLNMFRHPHEVRTGRTSSISQEILGFDGKGNVVNYRELMTLEQICENSTKLITFMDLPGHKKFFRTAASGLMGYMPQYIIIVVSSCAATFGISEEHFVVALALDIPFFVVITKTDIAPADVIFSTLETILKNVGCNKIPFIVTCNDVVGAVTEFKSGNTVPTFCISNVTGEGLDYLSMFLYLLNPGMNSKEKESLEQELCEFQVNENFHMPEVGSVVGGILSKGSVTEGEKLLIGPYDDGGFRKVTVQSIYRNKAPSRAVRANQSASFGFSQELSGLRKGMVLLSPQLKPTASMFFQATVLVLFHPTAIRPGFQTTVHIGSIRQAAVIEGVMAVNGIRTNERSSVLFRFMCRPEYIKVGMPLLFREGETKGIGKVIQVFVYHSTNV